VTIAYTAFKALFGSEDAVAHDADVGWLPEHIFARGYYSDIHKPPARKDIPVEALPPMGTKVSAAIRMIKVQEVKGGRLEKGGAERVWGEGEEEEEGTARRRELPPPTPLPSRHALTVTIDTATRTKLRRSLPTRHNAERTGTDRGRGRTRPRPSWARRLRCVSCDAPPRPKRAKPWAKHERRSVRLPG